MSSSFSLHAPCLLFLWSSFAKDKGPVCQIPSLCLGRGAGVLSNKPFLRWGLFSFLFWEIASSFPKNVQHLLFKQGAFQELWLGLGEEWPVERRDSLGSKSLGCFWTFGLSVKRDQPSGHRLYLLVVQWLKCGESRFSVMSSTWLLDYFKIVSIIL